MRFANPTGLWLLGLAAPIVLLHVLRPRRRPVEVPSTFLWKDAPRTVSSAVPWQRLVTTPLFWLQIAAVILFALAVARPVRLTASPLAEHTVFILDASGSMAARDGDPTRLDAAKARARELRGQVPMGGLASLVVAGAEPRVLVSASPDERDFRAALDVVEAVSAPADMAAAFTLAESLETPEASIGFVLLSDGRLDPGEVALMPPGTVHEPVGSERGNVALSRLGVERRGATLHARLTVQNHGRDTVARRIVFTVDGTEQLTTSVRVAGGEAVSREVDLPGGDHVEARLRGEDLLAADDVAHALAGRPRELSVVMAGPGDPFLSRLFEALPGIALDTIPEPRPAPEADLVIYDRVAVPSDPKAPYLAIAPPGGMDGVEVTGHVPQPAVTLVRTDDALLRGLDLSEVAVVGAQRIEAPGDEILIAAPDAPLLVRGSRHGRPFAYLSFALGESNLPLQLAFPILGDRLVNELAGGVAPPPDLRVGDRLPVPPGRGALVVSPTGEERELAATDPVPDADAAGVWRIEPTGRPQIAVAANPDPVESELAPQDLGSTPRTRSGGGAPGTGEVPLLPWVVGILGTVLAAEWLIGRREAGVSRRRWRVARGVRLGIVGLLVAALAGVALPRSGEDVATVFLIDASDSMGIAGRRDAAETVRGALEELPQGARAGVAAFGGDARLELTVQREAELVGRAVQVDGSRSDLATALRLGAAVLPTDTRRRIVLLSDGRPTHGDLDREVERLAAQGIPVDVVPVTPAAGSDAAVVSLEVPDPVRVGEAYAVRVELASTVPAPVRLTLRRDDVVVDERVVEVDGTAAVEIAERAEATGLVRYRAEITADGDATAENDVANAATRIIGAPRVLVAEGRQGAGGELASALVATGLDVVVTAAASLPGLEALSAYEVIVLADVSVPDLSREQTDALTGAVRDLGRGLVTIGGERSYGLGGYLDTPLEELLPVVSDITDPERRPPVAQVIVVDASGSMGEPVGGGAAKIDVARTGAVRAVAALKDNDQVGVMSFNTSHRWMIELGPRPSEDEATAALGKLRADGGTMIAEPLRAAGAALDGIDLPRKHVILFSDGISGEPELPTIAGELAERGITVSAVGTGASLAGPELERVAAEGGGRFYAAEDPSRIPEVLTQEAVLASRNFVNEGEFLPVVRASAPATETLQTAPPLLGYIATTAKPAARTLLTVGEDEDPLLATWRTGLGRATSWMSDGGVRWAQLWAPWDGYPTFFSALVKDALPLGGVAGTSVRARVEGDRILVTVEGAEGWPDGATAKARVASPDGRTGEVRLDRTSPTAFAGEVDARVAGSYAVGVGVSAGDRTLYTGTALATRAYAPEYRPQPPDPGLLRALSLRTGGRGIIEATDAFDPAGLVPGRGRVPLTAGLLLAAALLWPVDVALRRLALHGTAAQFLPAIRRRLRRPEPAGLPTAQDEPEAPEAPTEDTVAAAPPTTLERLLERKRGQ